MEALTWSKRIGFVAESTENEHASNHFIIEAKDYLIQSLMQNIMTSDEDAPI